MGENIFVCNTLPGVTEDLNTYLKGKSYTVFHMKDRIEIEKKLRHTLPDLIIVEFFLVNSESIKLADTIKSMRQLHEVPKIAICHWNLQCFTSLVETVGFDDVLIMPFGDDDLEKAMERHIGSDTKVIELKTGEVVIECQHRLDSSNTARVEKVIDRLIENGRYDFIIDLGRVATMDSTGIGLLVLLNKRLKKIEGTLRVANLNQGLAGMFSTLHMGKLLEIIDFKFERQSVQSIPEAVSSVNDER
ncbi:MAG: STAS domain-containing protein [Candidatus Zhuqueibacterota bacterium]